MGTINEDLFEDETDMRLDESAMRGYIVTTRDSSNWHIVSAFEEDGIHLFCDSERRITSDDNIILFDIEEDEVYSTDLTQAELRSAPNEVCDTCMPRYEMVSSWSN